MFERRPKAAETSPRQSSVMESPVMCAGAVPSVDGDAFAALKNFSMPLRSLPIAASTSS